MKAPSPSSKESYWNSLGFDAAPSTEKKGAAMRVRDMGAFRRGGSPQDRRAVPSQALPPRARQGFGDNSDTGLGAPGYNSDFGRP